MGLFRNKSGDGNRPHGGIGGSQALEDPENPPISLSAPHAVQPYQQQQPQHHGITYLPATAPPGAPSAASNTLNPAHLNNAAALNLVTPAKGETAQQAAAEAVILNNVLTADQQRTLRHMQHLTHVMDDVVTIPVINRRVGLDALIGLIPFVGDAAGSTVGLYIISQAMKYNLPKRLVLHMLANQAIDSCIGIIPFVGDIFDIGWKANTRNMRLLQNHLERPKQAKRADTCFLCTFFFLVVIVPFLIMACVVVAIVLGVMAATGRL